MTEEIGLAQPVEYAEAERRTIATHESGHATVAWLVGTGRKLEVLSIVKRRTPSGSWPTPRTEERFTKTRTEIEALIQIAFGGMVAEEMFFGETQLAGWPATCRPPPTAAAQMVGQPRDGEHPHLLGRARHAGGNIVAKVTAVDAGRDEVESCCGGAKDEVRDHARGQPQRDRSAARRPARARRARRSTRSST